MQREIGPLNDFIFKQILGKPGCEKELLVFLNAIMAVKKLPTFKSNLGSKRSFAIKFGKVFMVKYRPLRFSFTFTLS